MFLIEALVGFTLLVSALTGASFILPPRSKSSARMSAR